MTNRTGFARHPLSMEFQWLDDSSWPAPVGAYVSVPAPEIFQFQRAYVNILLIANTLHSVLGQCAGAYGVGRLYCGCIK